MPAPTYPGPYLYRDPIGGPPLGVFVLDDGGELLARFPGVDGEPGEELPVADLAGEFGPPLTYLDVHQIAVAMQNAQHLLRALPADPALRPAMRKQVEELEQALAVLGRQRRAPAGS